MATYAPLFAHVEGWQWRPDMIWFDNLRSMPTASYYIQQLYAVNKGDQVVPLKMDGKPVAGNEDRNGLFASAVKEDGGDLIVKVANVGDKPGTWRWISKPEEKPGLHERSGDHAPCRRRRREHPRQPEYRQADRTDFQPRQFQGLERGYPGKDICSISIQKIRDFNEKLLSSIALSALCAIPAFSANEAMVSLLPAKESPIIRKEIYGQFAEHLGTCIYGGLWPTGIRHTQP